MLALTIHQPWAHLIAIGRKTIETRTWLTAHRGPLAIHASVQKPNPQLCRYFQIDPAQLQHGCVIAVGNIATSRRLTASDSTAACCGAADLCGMIFDRVIRLPDPVFCRGLQKLWHLPGEVLDQVRAQLAAADSQPIALASSPISHRTASALV